MVTFDIDEYVRANSLMFEERLAQSNKDAAGKEMLRRRASLDIGQEVMRFVAGDVEDRLILLPGLRGVGKSTLLKQVHQQLITEGNIPPARILHVSMDEAMGILGVGLFDLAGSMERLLGRALHSLREDEKVFFLIDEAQYDPKWGIAAKVIFDSAKNVCQVITGSSALDLQVNPDVARRASFREIWPMDLDDYMHLRKGVEEISPQGGQVTRCLLTAADVSHAKKEIDRYPRDQLNRIEPDDFELSRYLRIGGYPLSVSPANEIQIIDGIYRSLEKVIAVDLARGENYETDTLSKVMGIMGLMAASGRISYEKMAVSVGLSKPTVIRVMEDLRKAGALIRIDALGSAYDQVRKTPQYRPATPGLRMAMIWKAGAWRGSESQMGALLEDSVASTLHHARQAGMIATFYADEAPGGADFLVQRMDGLRVVVEVSWGKKDRRQAKASLVKRDAAYAVICARNQFFTFDDEEMVIEAPRAAMLNEAVLPSGTDVS